MLDWLDRRFGRFGIANVTVALIAVQAVALLFNMVDAKIEEKLVLVPERLLDGEWWRLLTFLATPPSDNPIVALLFWSGFYVMGTALEQTWGAFRYNVYLLLGYVATLACMVIAAYVYKVDLPATNAFLKTSVLLAFAFLYPDFMFYVYFIVPVKVKYLAGIAWVAYLVIFAIGHPLMRLLVVGSIVSFFVFFWRDLLFRARMGHRRTIQRAKHLQAREKFFHVCTVCGITDRSHPEMDFRYCSQCVGTKGYCTDHIRNHEHVTAESAAAQASDAAAKLP